MLNRGNHCNPYRLSSVAVVDKLVVISGVLSPYLLAARILGVHYDPGVVAGREGAIDKRPRRDDEAGREAGCRRWRGGCDKPASSSVVEIVRCVVAQCEPGDPRPSGDMTEVESRSPRLIGLRGPKTWDQWIKRETPARLDTMNTIAEESESASKGSAPETTPEVVIKNTRFKVIPRVDVWEPRREVVMMGDPMTMIESHLDQLTMVESQLKKLTEKGGESLADKPAALKLDLEAGRGKNGTGGGGPAASGSRLGWLALFKKKPAATTQPAPPPQAPQPRPPRQRPPAHHNTAGPITKREYRIRHAYKVQPIKNNFRARYFVFKSLYQWENSCGHWSALGMARAWQACYAITFGPLPTLILARKGGITR
ncbi:hypothetical protein AAG570_001419 [Ranatra chinensis]|uniref:Uncharacterized protein n=1 Tax=Ranatra chinensis TaxID=642074 RepID=A0ABD0YUD2_9HEMI